MAVPDAITAKEIQQARTFLFTRGFDSRDIPPKLFASAAKSSNLTFQELLKTIGTMLDGTQQGTQSPVAAALTGDSNG